MSEDLLAASTPDSEIVEYRVELRRYLGGVLFSHCREMSKEERQTMRRQLGKYASIGGTFVLVALIPWLSMSSIPGFALFMTILISCVPIGCLWWSWPFLQALRKSELHIYISRLRDLEGFDLVQSYYRKNPDFEQNIDRYVELQAVGNGERIWRIEGLDNDETLSVVHSIQVAMVPDHDERGERPLLKEEVKELRLRSREYLRITPIILSMLLPVLVGLGIWGFAIPFIPVLAPAAGVAAGIATTLALFRLYRPRWQFGITLRRDIKAGKVIDGNLASGTQWVVEGEPARWRLGWTRHG